MWSRFWRSTVIFALLRSAAASPPFQVEVNISMCNWAEFRANIIRDTIYLDGGELWWQIGLSDGTYDPPQNDANSEGLLYTLNLGQPFGPTTNLTALFTSISKVGGAITQSIAPNYVDGVMFANNDELILYGGLTQITDNQTPPPANATLGYEGYQYGQDENNWQPSFVSETLSDGVSRYVTNGAGVSAPSENLGFYFSGMRAPDWGLIQNGDGSPNTTANTLISVDMSVMGGGSWANDTLPDNIPGRANAELVWIPVSSSGVLLATGGVINPASLTAAQVLTEQQAAASNKTSPTFMETVSIYDIATKKWYLQNTTGDIPPQLTLFCSVVAAASDGSSYNIYIYGGYDGVDVSSPSSDDVYILSVPSFTWIKAYSGERAHGRSGHKCVKAYPDQMFVLGGVFEGDPTVCLNGGNMDFGIIQVFNLNTLRFQDSYSPEIWNNYSVPSLVTAQIGGSGEGGATKTAPSTWNNNALSTVFQSKYTGTIETYYPYPLVNATSTPTSTPTTGPITVQNSGSGFPNWAGAVIGVVGGLIIGAAGAVFWLLHRRRKDHTLQGSVQDSHRNSYKQLFLLKWLYGAQPSTSDESSHGAPPNDEKDGSVTVVATCDASQVMSPGSDVLEADSSAVHEIDSPPPRFELATEYNFRSPPTPVEDHPSPSVEDVLHMYMTHNGTS